MHVMGGVGAQVFIAVDLSFGRGRERVCHYVCGGVVYRRRVCLSSGRAGVQLSVGPAHVGRLVHDPVAKVTCLAVVRDGGGACAFCGDGGGWVGVCEGRVWCSDREGVV